MRKTKRYNKRAKSRKIKRGGRKYNNMALQTTQIVGGAVGGQAASTPAPAPAPVSILRLANLDESSVRASLQSFGDSVYTLQSAVEQGQTTAQSIIDAATLQKTALDTLKASADRLVQIVAGPTGLYNKLVVTPFVQTPQSPAPAPV